MVRAARNRNKSAAAKQELEFNPCDFKARYVPPPAGEPVNPFLFPKFDYEVKEEERIRKREFREKQTLGTQEILSIVKSIEQRDSKMENPPLLFGFSKHFFLCICFMNLMHAAIVFMIQHGELKQFDDLIDPLVLRQNLCLCYIFLAAFLESLNSKISMDASNILNYLTSAAVLAFAMVLYSIKLPSV